MVYLKWTQDDLVTLEMEALYTEVDEDGWVQRELGVADDGAVVHQLTPNMTDPGWFGLCRLAIPRQSSAVSAAEFEALWQSAR